MCVPLMPVTYGPVRSIKRRTENMFRTIRNEWPVVFSGNNNNNNNNIIIIIIIIIITIII